MNKCKQIFAILFPHGLLATYIPAWTCLIFNCGSFYIFRNDGDLGLFLICIGMAASLRVFYSTYQLKKHRRQFDAMMEEVFNTVRPEIDALFHRYMIDGEGDFKAMTLMAQESHEIIQKEVYRRRNHSRVSKPDKP